MRRCVEDTHGQVRSMRRLVMAMHQRVMTRWQLGEDRREVGRPTSAFEGGVGGAHRSELKRTSSMNLYNFEK